MPSASRTRAEVTKYVYGVGWAGAGPPSAEGVGQTQVAVLEHGELAALVSELPSADIRARRRDLMRHAEVLRQGFAQTTLVPLGFGTVFGSEDEVISELLEPRYEDLVSLLQDLDGLVELTLRAFYDEPLVLAAILRDHPEIAALRGSQSPGDQVRLGEAVARALSDRRTRDADEIVAELSAHARKVVVEERVAEFELVRAAFLVGRPNMEQFDARAQELAERYGGIVRFKLTGPLPPHHFVAERWAS